MMVVGVINTSTLIKNLDCMFQRIPTSIKKKIIFFRYNKPVKQLEREIKTFLEKYNCKRRKVPEYPLKVSISLILYPEAVWFKMLYLRFKRSDQYNFSCEYSQNYTPQENAK